MVNTFSPKSKMFLMTPKPEHAHTAQLVRSYLLERKMSMHAFARALGVSGEATPYPWVTGRGSISKTNRPAVAKLLGVPEEALKPNLGAKIAHVELGPARQAVALVRERVPAAATAASSVPASPPATGGRLTYEGHGDGTATIAVKARLPLDQAKPLFRLLLDSGIDLEQAQEAA
jgi:transcriptional regulator with XRE-family HTH domain